MSLTPSDLGPLHTAPAYQIYRLSRLLRHGLRQVLQTETHDVSPEQYFILYRLYRASGVSQNTLADPVLGDYPNVTRLLGGMAERGLIERTPDPSDRRRSLVAITDLGRTFMQDVAPRVQVERDRLFGNVPQDELDAAMRLFDRLQHTLTT